jgi:hypothetical protein
LPAQQCFDANDPPVAQRDLWLVVQEQFLAFKRAMQLRLQRKGFPCLGPASKLNHILRGEIV